uniref:Uncharacterized protein n=1 Tax=Eucampia antarctica TaxID=49252 RepID=A0A7S2RJD5_9STRA|mmetsp:Transcript_23044/g.22115  ORF Transcript_23044/g.22115 Transcript_23044/m.22115 type:complete len:267 (+) Transcript_23044:490-1290(+)
MAQYPVEEAEDIVQEDENFNEEAEVSESVTPDNDFCFTNDNFIEYRTVINDVARYQSKYIDACSNINSLEGHEVIFISSSDGRVVRMVVDKVTDDNFEKIRKFEDKKFEDKMHSPMKDPAILKYLNYSESFWHLWPKNIEDDITKINPTIVNDNHSRKERYQRALRMLNTSEYIMFTALMLGAAVYNDDGEKLWNATSDKKRRQDLLQNIDYGQYMKQWRFKEIKSFKPEIMVDIERKKTTIGGNSLHKFKIMDNEEKIKYLHLMF